MKSRSLKRTLSAILAVMMIVGLLPLGSLTAVAAGEPTITKWASTTNDSVTFPISVGEGKIILNAGTTSGNQTCPTFDPKADGEKEKVRTWRPASADNLTTDNFSTNKDKSTIVVKPAVNGSSVSIWFSNKTKGKSAVMTIYSADDTKVKDVFSTIGKENRVATVDNLDAGTYYIGYSSGAEDANGDINIFQVQLTEPAAAVRPADPEDTTTAYTIAVDTEITGGTLKVTKKGESTDATSATKGTQLTITATPGDGKELEKITISKSWGTGGDKVDKGSDELTAAGDYTMPQANIEVTATFKDLTRSLTLTLTNVTATVKVGTADAAKYTAPVNIVPNADVVVTLTANNRYTLPDTISSANSWTYDKTAGTLTGNMPAGDETVTVEATGPSTVNDPPATSDVGEGKTYAQAEIWHAADIKNDSNIWNGTQAAPTAETKVTASALKNIDFYVSKGDDEDDAVAGFKVVDDLNKNAYTGASGTTYNSSIQGRKTNPTVDSTTKVPSGYGYFKFVPKKDGLLEIAGKTSGNPSKSITVVSDAEGSFGPMSAYDLQSGNSTVNASTIVDVKADKTYYYYVGGGSKAVLYGFTFWPKNDPASSVTTHTANIAATDATVTLAKDASDSDETHTVTGDATNGYTIAEGTKVKITTASTDVSKTERTLTVKKGAEDVTVTDDVFTMPDGDVTVTVSYAAPAGPSTVSLPHNWVFGTGVSGVTGHNADEADAFQNNSNVPTASSNDAWTFDNLSVTKGYKFTKTGDASQVADGKRYGIVFGSGGTITLPIEAPAKITVNIMLGSGSIALGEGEAQSGTGDKVFYFTEGDAVLNVTGQVYIPYIFAETVTPSIVIPTDSEKLSVKMGATPTVQASVLAAPAGYATEWTATATSGNAEVATGAVSNTGLLTITPVGVGRTTLTIAAKLTKAGETDITLDPVEISVQVLRASVGTVAATKHSFQGAGNSTEAADYYAAGLTWTDLDYNATQNTHGPTGASGAKLKVVLPSTDYTMVVETCTWGKGNNVTVTGGTVDAPAGVDSTTEEDDTNHTYTKLYTITPTAAEVEVAFGSKVFVHSLTVTKNKVDLSGATLAIEGTAKIGETLTASLTGTGVNASDFDFTWTLDGATSNGTTFTVPTGSKGKTVALAAAPKTAKADDYTGSVTGATSSAIVGKEITATVTGFTGDYDGQAHGLTVNITAPASGYTVKYSETENNFTAANATTPITKTNASTTTVYVEITHPDYETATKSAAITINKVTLSAKPTVSVSPNKDGDSTQGYVGHDGGTVTFTISGIPAASSVAPSAVCDQKPSNTIAFTKSGANWVGTNNIDSAASDAQVTHNVIFTWSDANFDGTTTIDAVTVTQAAAGVKVPKAAEVRAWDGTLNEGSTAPSYADMGITFTPVAGNMTITVNEAKMLKAWAGAQSGALKAQMLSDKMNNASGYPGYIFVPVFFKAPAGIDTTWKVIEKATAPTADEVTAAPAIGSSDYNLNTIGGGTDWYIGDWFNVTTDTAIEGQQLVVSGNHTWTDRSYYVYNASGALQEIYTLTVNRVREDKFDMAAAVTAVNGATYGPLAQADFAAEAAVKNEVVRIANAALAAANITGVTVTVTDGATWTAPVAGTGVAQADAGSDGSLVFTLTLTHDNAAADGTSAEKTVTVTKTAYVPQAVTITVTLGEHVTAVKYKIDGGTEQSITVTGDIPGVVEGNEVTITDATFDEDYELDAITGVAGNAIGGAVTVTSKAGAVSVTAKATTAPVVKGLTFTASSDWALSGTSGGSATDAAGGGKVIALDKDATVTFYVSVAPGKTVSAVKLDGEAQTPTDDKYSFTMGDDSVVLTVETAEDTATKPAADASAFAAISAITSGATLDVPAGGQEIPTGVEGVKLTLGGGSGTTNTYTKKVPSDSDNKPDGNLALGSYEGYIIGAENAKQGGNSATSSKLPDNGTYYVFEVSKDGTLVLDLAASGTGTGKAVVVYRTNETDSSRNGAQYEQVPAYKTAVRLKYAAKAGDKYIAFTASGSKLGFFGFYFKADGGAPAATTYDVTWTAEPSNWEFTDVTNDGAAVATPTSPIAVAEGKTLTFKVNVKASGKEVDTVKAGTTTLTPNASGVYSVVVNAATTLAVTLKNTTPDTQQVTVSYNAKVGTTALTGVTGLPAGGKVDKGTSVTKPDTDPSKEGYTFVGWYVGSDEATFPITANADVTLTAVFTKNGDKTEMNKQVAAAKTAKDNLVEVYTVADDAKPADVKYNTKYVTKTAKAEALTALDAAIAAAEALPASATQTQVDAATKALTDAIANSTKILKTGTKDKPLGGGGSSADRGETTTPKPDGTVTNPDGSVTTVETKPDGSKVETVKEKDGSTVETVTSKEGDVAITVTDPEGEVLAEVKLPATVDTSRVGFKDVPAGHWAEKSINNMAALGVVNGVAEDVYDMNSAITRGAVASILFRFANGKEGIENSFSDVADGAWYDDGVSWAAKAGVVTGYENGTFGPDGSITREQLAVMLFRYAKLLGLDTAKTTDLTGYVDGVKVQSWASQGMAWCVANGIINGRGGAVLDPSTTATRAEAAVMLDRLVGLVK